MKNIQDKIIVIMGLTSSGKTVISNRVSKELGIPMLVTHTSRPPRNQEEIDNQVYYFVDNDYFEEESKFVEIREYNTEYGTWKYGLSIEELASKPISIGILDRQGHEELCEVLGEDNVISIFIEVDEETLRQRHIQRGDCPKEFERRIQDDKKRLKGFLSDYVVTNDNLDRAISKVKEIIKEELGGQFDSRKEKDSIPF